MTKICLVTSAEGPRLKQRQELFDKLKAENIFQSDTVINIKSLSKKTHVLRPYAETLYFELLQSQYFVEGVIQAEKEGNDAAIIGCYFDPGLEAAREVVKIPVLGIAEASMSVATLLTRKNRSIAAIAVAEKGILKTEDVLEKYGYGQYLISHRPVRQIPIEMYINAAISGKRKDVEDAKAEFLKISRECVKDGAELIISACGGLGPMMSVEGIFQVDGAQVLDPVVCAVKMAETMVALQKFGIDVSRKLMYRPPLTEDFGKNREIFGFPGC
ncbi:aspartate/glutamate racemase family protein [Chloroflexota bacterium]